MTYAGARGQTAKEMCQVLRLCQLKHNVHVLFDATLASLNAARDRYILNLANGVFVDKRFTLRQSYRSLLSNCYSASFKQLDFTGDPTGAAEYINRWVEDRTNDKIQDIVSEGDVKDAPLVLANAIYFKGQWKCQFDPDRTDVAKFHISSSESTQVNMMTQTARFRYSLNRRLNCQILELPYKGNRLAMYILLPKKVDGLASLERKLTFYSITSALALLRPRRISVAIPRFEMTVGKNIPTVLKAMGMNLAFTTAADFTGISPVHPLFVSDVIHKAFIGVDEEGTEAAAATVVIFARGTAPGPLNQKFAADHPFVFLIRDKVTGSILFFGRLVNPAE